MAFTIASSAADGLKTWTYTGSPGASVVTPRSQLRGGTGGAAQCARFNHNGQVIVGAGASGVITLWHTNGTVLGELVRNKDRGQPIHSLFFSSGSRYLATGGVDRVVKIWDLKRREIIRSFKSHKTAVSCVQFSKDADKFVASGALSGKVCVFNVLSGRLVNTLEPPETPEVPKSASSMGVQAVSFSPFRKSILAAAYNDGCVRMWDISIGASGSHSRDTQSESAIGLGSKRALLHTFSNAQAKGSRVRAVSFSPTDPNMLMSAGHDKMVRLYDTKSASAVSTLEADTALSCACFVPDGRHIVAGTLRGELLVFDSRKIGESVHPVARVTAHGQSEVTSVQVQPVGKHRASSSAAGGKSSNNSSKSKLSTASEEQAKSDTSSLVGSASSSSTASAVDPSIASLRTSLSSVDFKANRPSDSLRSSQRSGSSSTASSISRLPQNVSVFSAVKKPRMPRAQHPKSDPVNMEISSELPPARLADSESETDDLIQGMVATKSGLESDAGSGKSTEVAASRVSAVTASTLSLEEQIRNLLHNPSDASKTNVKPIPRAPNYSTASKESDEKKQDLTPPAVDKPSSVSETVSNSTTSRDEEDRSLSSQNIPEDVAASVNLPAPVIQHIVRDEMSDMCADLRGDIQNMHVELIRQFQIQLTEVRGLLDEYTTKFADIAQENLALRRENELLRNIY